VFIDASAAVAIILDETDREALHKKLKSSKHRTMSAIASYETVMAIRRVKQLSVEEAHNLVLQFQKILAIKLMAIEPRQTEIALDAFARYGRGQGHPAQLNMGDCFSYACAKILKEPLLFKGNDFGQTDIKIA
jgi:ribonuclease VapC